VGASPNALNVVADRPRAGTPVCPRSIPAAAPDEAGAPLFD